MLDQGRVYAAGVDRVRRRARGFVTGARGSVSIEFVLSLPLMLWGLAAMVVFFNGYQARYHAQMAAQTVADIMSRETNLFTANYIEGLNDVYDFLADNTYETRLRVSSVI
ncbi:TadE/TadG family type IV pilus assembly protein, partial [Pararhodobacter marinus]|uniref:TadE/TadG family type IV pilus assembly protein n=1 Tax=Pararhodobacter marinus TaxID=2184063 RepID=UPI003515311C